MKLPCRTSLVSSALLCVAACGDAGTGLLPPEDPEPFEVDGLVVGPLAYVCSQWQYVPHADPVTLDFFFAAQDQEGPRDSDLDALTEVGATVVHEFEVAAARAVMRLSAVASIRGPEWGLLNHVRAVPAPDRFDVEVVVLYDSFLGTALRERVLELGGYVRDEWARERDFIAGLRAVLPDTAIAVLRTEFGPKIGRLEHDAFGCLGW